MRPNTPLSTLRALVVGAVALVTTLTVTAQQPGRAETSNQPCGPIHTNHYGPFDYRTQRSSIKVVEDFHYTPRVEAALGGATGSFGGDINYTLKAAPNHHPALVSLVRWTERVKRDQTQGMEWPIECYFVRAITFAPDDTVVRALYAQWLVKRKRTADAVNQLDAAVEMAGDSAYSHFNLGLLYVETGDLAKALKQAHRALALDFPRQDLVDALKKAGAWREPPAPEPVADAASGARSTEAPRN